MKNIKLNLRVGSYPLGVYDIDYSGGGDWLPSLGSLQNPMWPIERYAPPC